jgi:protein phosphatase
MPEHVAFTIAVFAMTDVGMVRQVNEDNFLVLNLSTADTWTPGNTKGDPDEKIATFTQSACGSVLAVTDGIGGALAGEVASRMAVESVRERMIELQSSRTYSRLPFHERLRLSIELTNKLINDTSATRREYMGMGATFTAVGLYGTTAYFGQVGDSRAYVIRGSSIQQITRDQSLVGQLVQAGHITEEEAERHAYKNVILQALGAAPRVNVAIDQLQIHDLDILVMCSDGLSNKVRSEEMHQIIDRAPSLKEACEDLIKLANRRGGEDNITVLISQFTGSNVLPPQPYIPTSDTVPLINGAPAIADTTKPAERWGAVTLPRDPNLPYEIDPRELYEEEDTLRPADGEGVKR